MCICSLPAQERTISLDTIGQKTKLEVDGVEFLLMKTLSLHLIEGVVDQVDGNVKVQATTTTLLVCLSKVQLGYCHQSLTAQVAAYWLSILAEHLGCRAGAGPSCLPVAISGSCSCAPLGLYQLAYAAVLGHASLGNLRLS